MKMKWKKLSLGKLFDNKKFVWIFAFVVAIITWFVVAFTVSPEINGKLTQVPVNIDIQSTSIGRLGLDVVDGEDSTVDVWVTGERYVVGSLTADDVIATASLAGVTGAGSYDLKIQVSKRDNSQAFEIISNKPETVRVTFDRLSTQTLSLDVDVSGVVVPDGYMMEQPYANPSEITITGPENDVSRVAKCVVRVEVDETLRESKVVEGQVTLLDKEGNAIENSAITMSEEDETVEVTIPILKMKELPVKLDFLHMPSGFPIDSLTYTLSNETIQVAGPTDAIDNMSELHLGYVDFSQLDVDSTFDFDVQLPSGFINIENINTITADFTNENLTSQTYTVDNINVVNQPANFDVTVNTQSISNVQIVGDASIIENLSASDIVAEVDLSGSEIVAGQFKVPVNIVIPGKGLVWAKGDYAVVVVVTANS
ncbi:MAG: YbbR-like domain-containing protein [Candidatus Pararuminococcus gallinarum]|jgi:YbbR domain-containing protein|uniref:CdaR family protein n=1 Tax=Zongyangia sp. HA2173 TaxID=3133035 RepID=UPI00316A9D8F